MKIFQTKKQLLQRVQELEKQLEELTKAAIAMNKRTYLFDISRDGRSNTFSFVRNGEVYQIETMGLISDNVQGWRDILLN